MNFSVFFNFCQQFPAVNAVVSGLQFPIHVHKPDLRKPCSTVAVRQLVQCIAPRLRIIIALNGRRCRGEHQERLVIRAAELCHIPRMVARRRLRLIGVLLLFVQNHQPQVIEWGEHRRPRADRDGNFPAAHPFPFVQALGKREAAMKYRHSPSIPAMEQRQALRRQRDLRHHDNDVLPIGEHLVDQAHED